MTILIAIAIGVPCLGMLAFLGMRQIQSLPFARSLALARSADMRGIALQTIIIMVVLLAIAGSVAAVILSRAGEETANLEQTESAAYGITNETGCELGGYTWMARTGLIAAGPLLDALNRARPDVNWAATGTDGYCIPS